MFKLLNLTVIRLHGVFEFLQDQDIADEYLYDKFLINFPRLKF